MKKLVSIIYILFFFYTYGWTTNFTVNGINYNTTSTNTVEVAYGSSYSGIVNIPSTVINSGLTYTVTSIGTSAFSGTDVSEVSIPNTITKIGINSFFVCIWLNSIKIPSSVTIIGSGAFAGCKSLNYFLTESLVPINISTSTNVFSGTNPSCKLCVPFGTSSLYKAANQWNSFSSINEVQIVNAISYRKISASEVALTNKATYSGVINIPSKITVSGINYSVTAIDTAGFCSWITSQEYPTPNVTLTSVTLPSTISTIDDYAFYGCKRLHNIILPQSLKKIGTMTFSYCDSLQTIVLPSGLEILGEAAFLGCIGLKSINIPSSITKLNSNLFRGCYLLNSISLTDFVKIFESGVFFGCKNLSTIIIPKNLESIGAEVFVGCTSLSAISLPSSITSIGNSAFAGCTSLSAISLPSSITSIGNSAFAGCTGLGYINYSSLNCLNIGIREKPAFSGCIGVKSLIIGDNVIDIPNYAFMGISGPKTLLRIGRSVKNIGNNAFSGCSSFSDTLTIPESVESIGDSAFYQCIGFSTLKYNAKKCIKMGSKYNKYVFSGCTGISTIIVGDSVTTFSHMTFYGCYNYSKIIFNAIKCDSIFGDRGPFDAFEFSHNNKSFEIGTKVLIIPNRICEFATHHTGTLNIGNSVISIGEHAFSLCFRLNKIVIPSSVKYIGDVAFELQYPVIDLFYNSITTYAIIPPKLGYKVFLDVPKHIPLYVPNGSINAYKQAEQWKDFENIIEIKDSVNIIEPTDTANPPAITVSFKKPTDWNTEDVWIFAWTPTNSFILGNWPGIVMNNNGNGWYSYTFDSAVTNINVIFSKVGNPQTVDILGVTQSTCYQSSGLSGSRITVNSVDCPVTSVIEPHARLHVFVSPQPARNQFEVRLPELTSTSFQLKIIDLSGIVVYKETFFGNSTHIKRTNLKAGFYIIQIKAEDGNEQFSTKLTIVD
jgi:hypothetical protein